MTIASLIVDVAANTAKLQTDVGRIHGQLDNVSSAASKMGAMLAGAFTVTAITSAASQVLNYASNISDLSAQTGLTTRSIQEMSHAAKMTGASLEQFTNAAFKLGTNIAGGSNSVVGSIERLGLSYAALKAMSPDEQFNVITTALGHVQNAQDRNKIAIDLFGKTAKDILPAITQGYTDLAKGATVAGDAQIQALDAAGDAIDRLKERVMGLGITILGAFAQSMEHLGTALKQDFEFIQTHTFDRLTQAVEDWGTIFGRAAQAPKVLSTALRDLPAPISAVNLSVEQQEQRMKALEVQHGRITVSTRSVAKAQEEAASAGYQFNNSLVVQADAFRMNSTLQGSVHRDFRLMQAEFNNTIPVLQNLTTNGFEPFRASIQATGTDVEKTVGIFQSTFAQLPGVIMGAIQGGGSVISAAGALIGTGLMTKFQTTFGPAITAALPFGIGAAITALLPSLGALFGPIAERIGGFFRSIFGGPSADELRGRQMVADFEAELHALLTTTQQVEAGHESWRMTVIAIRDAYIAQGLSEADALLAAERLWASSRSGGAASQAIIEEIRRIMAGAASAAGQFGANLDSATRPRTINIGFNVEDMPDLGSSVNWGGPQAKGGDYFVTRPTLFLAGEAGPERATFGGANRGEGGGTSNDEIRRLVLDLPRAMQLAMSDWLVLQGVR